VATPQSRESLIKLLGELKIIDLNARSILLSAPLEPIAAVARLVERPESEILVAVAKRLGLESRDLGTINPANPELRALVELLGVARCRTSKIIPLERQGRKLLLSVANPLDVETIRSLEFGLSYQLHLILSPESQIIALLNEVSPPIHAELEKLEVHESQLTTEDPNEEEVELVNPAQQDQVVDSGDAASPPVIRLANKILHEAIVRLASDIHLEPTATSLEVKMRVDGKIQPILSVPKRLQGNLITRFKLLAGMDIAERRRPQDGRLRAQVAGEAMDLRVASIMTAFGESLVLRLLRSPFENINLDRLDLSPVLAQSIRRCLESEGKLLLITGPTGSGKTTTLYACLRHLADGSHTVVTVEDPIEYRIAGIKQIQVNSLIDLTFPAVLRSILRQDPDVIMVGEIRDSETALIACQAAQTGHKVLSSLHTNDAPAAITRLMNLGVPGYVIASALGGVISQRLVRKVCRDCCTPLSHEIATQYAAQLKLLNLDPATLVHGKGCQACRNTGYKGRVALFTYVEVTEKVRTLISDGAGLQEITKAAIDDGFHDLHQTALEALRGRVTTLEEVLPYLDFTRQGVAMASSDPAVFNSSFKKPKILLIEDNAEVRSVLNMLLTKEMFEVIEAQHGAEGLIKLFEQQPELVLCDLMMPFMDGKQFMLRLKGHPATKDIPVIFLTALDSEENEIDLLELGAKDFISKASSSNVMLSRIRRTLVEK
jgi:type IV pilus assembly protein PilB